MNLRLDIKILKLWPKLVDHYTVGDIGMAVGQGATIGSGVGIAGQAIIGQGYYLQVKLLVNNLLGV